MARLNPTEIEKILPGAGLLAAPDIQRVCTLLGIALPDPNALAAMASGRKRATRSGRKFGSWGEPEENNYTGAGAGAGAGADAGSPTRKRARTRR